METHTDPHNPSSSAPAGDNLSYRALLQEYCSLLINKSAKNVGRSDDINIDGIDFTFYYQPQVVPELFYIRCEVFDIEGESDSKLVPRLLTDNLIRYHQHKPVFALCPDSKRVIALLKVSLRKTDSKALDEIVWELVQDVRQWRNATLSSRLNASDTAATSSTIHRANAQYPTTPTWETLNVTR